MPAPFIPTGPAEGGFTQQLGAPAPLTPAADLRTIDSATGETAENTAEANRILDAMNSKMKPAATGGGSGFAAGGTIRGPGTGTSDSIVMPLEIGGFILRERVNRALSGYAEGGKVLRRVSAGERYFTAGETAAIGLPVLQKLNAMSSGGRIRLPPGFDAGGDVDADNKQSTISSDELSQAYRYKFDTPRENIPDSMKTPPPFTPPPKTSLGVPHFAPGMPRPLMAGEPGFSRPLQPGEAGYARPSVYGEPGQPTGPPIHYEPPQVERDRAAYQQTQAAAGAWLSSGLREQQAREESQRAKAFEQFQKNWSAYRAREHNPADVGAAHARIWGGDPGPSAYSENFVPGHGLNFQPLFPKHPRPEHHSTFSVSVGGLAEGGEIIGSRLPMSVPKFNLDVLPRFDVGGPVTTSAAPPTVPSMGDEGVDFSMLDSGSRGVSMAPRIDPSASGQTHVIDWRINGEPVARGRGDDALWIRSNGSRCAIKAVALVKPHPG